MALFNDDELITVEVNSGSSLSTVGKVKVQPVICKKKASLEETNFKALVELKGDRGSTDRPGADIVTVLDVSPSMEDDNKLEKLKIAMQFLIRKLDPVDRLSIVTFAKIGTRLCPLRQMTKSSQLELEKLVDGLVVAGYTNITAGLEMALQVLKDRQLSEGRVGVIMLMSDGVHNLGGDPTKVKSGNVPVHTFGFGTDYDPKVLNGIASNSRGGTFSFVDVENLSAAFSQCLAGLLTVVAQDLKVTVIPLKGKVTKQFLGQIHDIPVGYPKSDPNSTDGSVTVSFGDLYAHETRKFLVDLLLFSVDKRKNVVTEVLKITGSYSYMGQTGKLITPVVVQVERTEEWENEPDLEEVIAEEKRQATVKKIALAMESADNDEMDDAKVELVKLQSELEDSKPDNINNEQVELMFDMLMFEVQLLKTYMKNGKIYKTRGRAFGLATITSHDKQRFAARIDPGIMDSAEIALRAFATPRMKVYLDQAIKFEKDPTKDLPTAEDDAKDEVADDPLAPFAGSFGYYLDVAIQALQAIQEMLKPPSSVKLVELP